MLSTRRLLPTLLSLGGIVVTVFAAPPAAAQTVSDEAAAEACGDVVEVDRFRQLRQLSLDLWGRVPTQAELEAVMDQDASTPLEQSTIEAMVESEEFWTFVRRYHFDLLWPNVEALDLVETASALLLPAYFYEYSDQSHDALFLLYTAQYNRGGLVPCKNEPAEFDDQGYPIMEEWPDGTMREGWVMVTPYWAPDTQVKVCALEARTVEKAYNGAECDTLVGLYSGGCGCGPSLNHCLGIDSALELQASLRDQFMRYIEAPIREGRSYFDVLLDPEEEVNGPLIHYYRYLAPMTFDPIVQIPPIPVASLPEVPYTDKEWRRLKRSPEHSGILTSMLYLLRFQTARARANRFYSAFLCSPFQAPDVDLPSPNDECSNEPNLRERCGCNYCHATLEPAAAHWAGFADAGTMFMNELLFPPYRADCATCAETGTCDFFCERFYLTEAGHPKLEEYVGWMESYVFRDDAEVDSLHEGPAALVEKNLGGPALTNCVVEKVFDKLYHRELTPLERMELVPVFAEAFSESGYDFKTLIKAMVTHEAYRRMAR